MKFSGKYLILVVVVIAILVSGVVYSSLISKPQTELETLRIGYQPSWHHTSEFVIVEKGWIQQVTGLDVKESEFPTGPPEMEAFIAGELDIAYVGAAPPIPALAKGMKAKIVASANTEGSALALIPDFEYTGPTSLRGAKLAAYPPGSIQDTVLKHWLIENDLEPGTDIKILAMGPRELTEALRANALDGIFTPEPMPFIAEVEGYGKIVADSSDMWPHHPCCVLLISEDLIMNHRELAKQILALHIIAQEYVVNPDNKDEVSRIIAEKLGLSEEVVDKFPGSTSFETDPHNPEWLDGIDQMAQVHYELGYTETVDGELILLNAPDIIDFEIYNEALELVPELKQELGLS